MITYEDANAMLLKKYGLVRKQSSTTTCARCGIALPRAYAYRVEECSPANSMQPAQHTTNTFCLDCLGRHLVSAIVPTNFDSDGRATREMDPVIIDIRRADKD